VTSAAGAVERTGACEADRHHLCRGTIVSLTADGAPCCCACHLGDERAVEAALERHHFDDPFNHGYGDA
jgi:hypothetical protein